MIDHDRVKGPRPKTSGGNENQGSLLGSGFTCWRTLTIKKHSSKYAGEKILYIYIAKRTVHKRLS